MDRNSKVALELFRQAQEAKERGENQEFAVDVAPQRVRLASQVDLSKADPKCKRCHGTGKLGNRVVPTEESEPLRVPIICRCVAENGGVTQDRFDQYMQEGKIDECH